MSQFPTNLVTGGGTRQVTPPAASAQVVAPPLVSQALVTVQLPTVVVEPPLDLTLTEPAPPPTAPPTLPTIGDCGTSALTHIAAASTPDAENPPVAATYPYRLKGTYDADGVK